MSLKLLCPCTDMSVLNTQCECFEHIMGPKRHPEPGKDTHNKTGKESFLFILSTMATKENGFCHARTSKSGTWEDKKEAVCCQ